MKNKKIIIHIILICIFLLGCEQKGIFDGTAPDLVKYPQDTPHSCLSSVIKAIEQDDFDYLINHLIDPQIAEENVDANNYEKSLNSISARSKENVSKLIPFLKADTKHKDNETVYLCLSDYNYQIAFRRIDNNWYFMFSSFME